MQSRHSTKQDLQHPSGHINSPYEQTLEKTPGKTFNNDELILEQISIREREFCDLAFAFLDKLAPLCTPSVLVAHGPRDRARVALDLHRSSNEQSHKCGAIP